MSLRTIRPLLSISLAVALALALTGCGSEPPRSDEPTTAKDKQLREANVQQGEPVTEGKWTGWRYSGDRNECFFVVGKHCFKTEAAACAAAKCGARKCDVVGGGPAAVSCAK